MIFVKDGKKSVCKVSVLVTLCIRMYFVKWELLSRIVCMFECRSMGECRQLRFSVVHVLWRLSMARNLDWKLVVDSGWIDVLLPKVSGAARAI